MIDFSRIKTFRSAFAALVGTAFGAGLVPIAPGTVGTLVAVPLTFWSFDFSFSVRAGLWVLIIGIGTWSAKVLDESMGSTDNQSIVIDEVAGFGITALTAGQDWKILGIAFLIFRSLDILKPFPVRQIDEWSKRRAANRSDPQSAWWGGVGVMADDIVAGFLGLVVILALQWLRVL